MKKFICALLLTVVASVAYAGDDCTIANRGFSPEVVVAMKKACEAAQAEASAPLVPKTAKEATQWGLMAQDFAKALGIAAHEIGVSVNEFVASPAGYITVAVILWKTVGGSIAKFIIVIAIWMIGLWFLRRMWTNRYVDREYKNVWGNLATKYTREYTSWKEAEESLCFCSFIVLIMMAGLTIIALATL